MCGIMGYVGSAQAALTELGYRFLSDTDTEVIAHLADYYYNGDILETVFRVISKLEGSYALGILCREFPDRIIAVRKDSPLVIGRGSGEHWIASDLPALLPYTKTVSAIGEGEVAVISANGVTVYNRDYEEIQIHWNTVKLEPEQAEKGGFEHFMMKEMMEQPDVIHRQLRQMLSGGEALYGLSFGIREVKQWKRIVIIGCGSAYHAGMVGKYVLEQLTRIPVEVDLASEFRYRCPVIDGQCLVLAVSQSGETADTLAAVREAKRLGCRVIAIVNTVGSSIANESDDVIETPAGPEIAVATTKAYSTQLVAFYLLAMKLGEMKGTLDSGEKEALLSELGMIPERVRRVLEQREAVQSFASRYANETSVFFIGRNLDYAVCLEGALKLKEISYIPAEAYAAGEMKHGPISLLEEGSLVIVPSTCPELLAKTVNNIWEVKARGAVVLAVGADERLREEADFWLKLPEIHPLFGPSLAVIVLQLFAYFVALNKECDIDKPRNLAKSVTVE